MKILNLYACLGGNRYKWNEVKSDIEVTAVELDPECARLYQERFPNDKVIVADAHQYLLDHYKEYDFIWSSPPCPTHSRLQISLKTKAKMKYPDMKLYDVLMPAKKRGRHLYWTNFNLPNILSGIKNPDFTRIKNHIEVMSNYHNYDFNKYNGKQSKSKMSNNLVYFEDGKIIFETMLGIVNKQNINQTELF